jgi:hypothetical protein
MPIEDFYVDIDMHFMQIKNFVLHKNQVGSVIGQAGYNTAALRGTIFDGISNKKILQENDIKDEDDMVSNSATHVPTQQSVKAYVDALESELASIVNGEGASKIGVEDVGTYFAGADLETVLQEVGLALSSLGSGINLKGNISAATNPNYPVAIKGDAWYISAAGKIGGASGKDVNIGDLVIASAANAGGTEAAVGASWFILESNRDQATETVIGVLKIATDALVNAGLNDTDAITSLKLKNRLNTVGMLTSERFVLTGKASTTIAAVNVGTKTFTLTGNITAHIGQGSIISITGSTGNNGLYTVVSVTLNVGDTDVVVEETILSAIADGSGTYGIKNDVTLSNINATIPPQVMVYKDAVHIRPYIKIISSSVVRIWFLSPATGTTFEAIIDGKFTF